MQRILAIIEEMREDLDGIETVDEARRIINDYLSDLEKEAYLLDEARLYNENIWNID